MEQERVKRRRIALACQTCQQKKVRCNGQKPCSHCKTHHVDCVFIQSRSRGYSNKDSRYIDVLGDRLSNIESLLSGSGRRDSLSPPSVDVPSRHSRARTMSNASATSPEQPPSATGVAIAPDPTRPPPSAAKASAVMDNDASTSVLADHPIMTDNDATSAGVHVDLATMMEKDASTSIQGDTLEGISLQQITPGYSTDAGELPHAAAPESGFSIVLPTGLQNIIDKIGGPQFKRSIAAAARSESLSDCWSSDVFKHVFTRPVFMQLPPKDTTVNLVNLWFREVNSAWPLFSQPTFMALLDKQYSATPYPGVGWWASLNIVLAGTFMLQSVRGSRAACLEKSQGYIKNAMAVLSELAVRSAHLMDLQAILCIVVVLQWTPDPRPASFLVPLALRIAHTLGLHKRQSDYSLDPLQAEQRRRVFWIAYRFHQDFGLRTGLPILHGDDDMDVELPALQPPDNLGLVSFRNGETTVNVFRVHAQLAILQAKIHSQLYTEAALKKTDETLLATIVELDLELEEWREGIPIDLDDSEYEIRTAPVPQSLCLLTMQFAYHYCLHLIHRTCLRHSYYTTQSKSTHTMDSASPNVRVFQSAELCNSSARASLRLLRCIPINDIGYVWRVIFFPVSSFIVLFANILHKPTEFQARSDLRLIRSTVELFSKPQYPESNVLKYIVASCSGLERIARGVVEQAIKRKGSRSTDSSTGENALGTSVPMTMRSAPDLTSGLFDFTPQPLFNNAETQFDPEFEELDFSSLMNELQPVFPCGDVLHGMLSGDAVQPCLYDF